MRKILAASLALIAGLAMCGPALALPTIVNPTSPAALLSGAPAANALDATFTAIDVGNGNRTLNNGQLMLIFVNSHETNAYTVTVTSVADQNGRTGDITAYSLAAGEYAIVGPLKTEGWTQTTGYVHYTAENAAVKVLPVQLRGALIYK